MNMSSVGCVPMRLAGWATLLVAAVLAGCGASGTDTRTTAAAVAGDGGAAPAAEASLAVTLSAATDEKSGDSSNLIDISDRWTAWDGTVSNVWYDPATDALRIGTPEAGRDMAIGVRRFDRPLTAGMRYTLAVRSNSAQAAVLLFPFDASGKIIPVDTGTGSTFVTARDGAPLSFVAPADVAGFFLQVQNRWRATTTAVLDAELVATPSGGPAGPDLVALTGPWTDWNGNPTAVTYDPVGQRLLLPPPAAGLGNTFAVRRFATALVAGNEYELSAGPGAANGTAVLLFLFDAQGRAIPFDRSTFTTRGPWLQAVAGLPMTFRAPAGVARFAIQVQSPWQATDLTWIDPSLERIETQASCSPITGNPEFLLPSQGPHFPPGSISLSDDGNVIAVATFNPSAITGEPAPACNTAETCFRLHVFIVERSPRRITRVTPASVDGTSPNVTLSGDGRFVFFDSQATNVIAGEIDPNGAVSDIFVFDRNEGVIRRVTNATSPLPHRLPGFDSTVSPRLASHDGRTLVFMRQREGLSPEQAADCAYGACNELLALDRATGAVTSPLASVTGDMDIGAVSMSGDGRFLALPHLGPSDMGITYVDRASGASRRFTASVGGFSRPSLSFDGQSFVFDGNARNPLPGGTTAGLNRWSVFVFDLARNTYKRLSGFDTAPDEWNLAARISASGNAVVTTVSNGEFVGNRSLWIHHLPTGGKAAATGLDFGYPMLSANGRILVARAHYGSPDVQSGVFSMEIDYPCERK